MDKQQALIEKINRMGEERTPFFLLVDFEGLKPCLLSIDTLSKQDIQFKFSGYSSKAHVKNVEKKITLEKYPIPFEDYKKKFDLVQRHLHDGNSFLTNLTCETPIESSSSLQEIYDHADTKYKIRFKDDWVCFSPETFITIKDNRISAYPMKGTIDASLPNAEQILLHDQKELSEHYTIVDLIRNDLSMVATHVTVKKFRYVDHIQTSNKSLLQVSSEIEGILPENFYTRLGNVLFALLPAGSISGAPKKKTLEIIQETEQYERGFYTGVAFYFDGNSIDSCVLIRFIEKKKSKEGAELVYKSGGGITIHSEAKKEYQEMIDKIYVPYI